MHRTQLPPSDFLNSGQASSRAAVALPVDEDAAVRFQDQLVTFDLHMRGNPYEQSGSKTGGSWQLRDRARLLLGAFPGMGRAKRINGPSTTPMSGQRKAGCMWLPSSISSPGALSAGR
jgi:hypothetical protein